MSTISLVPPATAFKPCTSNQIALYDDGVGTETFKPLAALGGAFGLGVWKNVQSLYTYLCRNYQPGDSVYLFGFSRGAFTAFPFSLYAIFRLWQFLHGTDVETFRFGSPTPAPAPVSDGGERVLTRA